MLDRLEVIFGREGQLHPGSGSKVVDTVSFPFSCCVSSSDTSGRNIVDSVRSGLAKLLACVDVTNGPFVFVECAQNT